MLCLSYLKEGGGDSSGTSGRNDVSVLQSGLNSATTVYALHAGGSTSGEIRATWNHNRSAHFTRYGYAASEAELILSIFDYDLYRNSYADLMNAFGDNRSQYEDHLLGYGINENRKWSPVYENDYYFSKYTDLKNAFGNNPQQLLKHFVNNGMNEGRQASPGFNVQIYKGNYIDLQNAFGDKLISYYQHFVSYGQKEKRNAVTPT